MIKKINLEILFFSLCFITFFVFFSYVHPLVVYDGDDWINLSAMRGAYPRWGTWNPIKILPETFMPICGYISAFFIYPITNDYIASITLCSAVIFSLLITAYFYFFYRVIKDNFELPTIYVLCITLIILFLHFSIFKSNKINNTYMFYNANLTCYFHYTLPALLNSIIVLYLLRFKNFLEQVNLFKSALLILSIYLAIFSNVFHSIILTAYISIEILYNFWKKYGNKFLNFNYLKEFAFQNRIWVALIGVWLISLLFEANGGRSNQIGRSILELPIKDTLNCLIGLLKQTSKGFIVVFLFSILGSAILYLKSKEKNRIDYLYKNIILKSTACFGLSFVYVLLIAAKASPGYIGNTNVAISFLFYVFVILFVSIAYIFQKQPKILTVLPLLCFIVGIFTLNTDKHFRESNMRNIAPYKCVNVDNDLINQIVTADKNGKTEMQLVVPKGDNRDNWPHPKYMGGNISRTLYSHGIISKNIKISVKPDENMNRNYHLGYFK